MDTEPLEVVERKGLGHPDYICDAVMERVVELAQTYIFYEARSGSPDPIMYVG